MENTLKYPKISIITPSYNQGQSIEETILSVINQNYPNLEYIIIDGGSTDNSVEIIKKYEKHLAYWVSEPDKGIYDAMNKGIQKATGDWLYFLGTDDILYNNSVLMDIFIKVEINEYNFIYGNILLRQSNKEIIYSKYSAYQIAHIGTICHQAIFVKKELFNYFGSFNTKYPISADYAFIIQSFGSKKVKIKYLDKFVAYYNESGASSYIIDISFAIDKKKLCKKYLNIKMDEKKTYEMIGKMGFDLLQRKKTREGLYYIFKTMFKNGRYFFYIKNTIYWIFYAKK